MMKIPRKPRFEFCLKQALDLILQEGFDRLPIDVFSLAAKYTSSVLTAGELGKKLGIPRRQIIRHKDADVLSFNGEYKIIYNEFVNSSERIRWTVMHEVAHIVLGHLDDFEQTRILSGGLTEYEYRVLEREADFFTAEVLVPKIVLRRMGVRFSGYIQSLCAVSEQAAKIRSKDLQSGNYQSIYDAYEEAVSAQFKNYIATAIPYAKHKYYIMR